MRAELRPILEATGLDRSLELVEPADEPAQRDAWLAPDDWTRPVLA